MAGIKLKGGKLKGYLNTCPLLLLLISIHKYFAGGVFFNTGQLFLINVSVNKYTVDFIICCKSFSYRFIHVIREIKDLA